MREVERSLSLIRAVSAKVRMRCVGSALVFCFVLFCFVLFLFFSWSLSFLPTLTVYLTDGYAHTIHMMMVVVLVDAVTVWWWWW